MYVETARVKQFYQKTFFIHRYNDETNRLFSMLTRKISKCLKILYWVFEKKSIVWITINLFWYFIYPFIQNQFLWNKIIIYITTNNNNNNKSYCILILLYDSWNIWNTLNYSWVFSIFLGLQKEILKALVISWRVKSILLQNQMLCETYLNLLEPWIKKTGGLVSIHSNNFILLHSLLY